MMICFTGVVCAQPSVKIGNMEIIVKKTDSDTVVQINVDEPVRPFSSDDAPLPKPKFKKYQSSTGFCGIGFILPDNDSKYYTTLGGSSINIDIGSMSRYHLTRWFALGGAFQYSYYNYKLRDAASDSCFYTEVTGINFDRLDLHKQTYRSHNLAVSAFTRFYLIPPKKRGKDGLYIDLGAQGDFAFSKYYKIKTRTDEKLKYRNGYAFNPFSASAFARMGCKMFGKESYALFVRYRFTDVFNKKPLPMDLPPITIGLQFF